MSSPLTEVFSSDEIVPETQPQDTFSPVIVNDPPVVNDSAENSSVNLIFYFLLFRISNNKIDFTYYFNFSHPAILNYVYHHAADTAKKIHGEDCIGVTIISHRPPPVRVEFWISDPYVSVLLSFIDANRNQNRSHSHQPSDTGSILSPYLDTSWVLNLWCLPQCTIVSLRFAQYKSLLSVI